MKKIIAILVVVALVFVSIYFFWVNRSQKNELELTYSSNGGVPFEWVYEIGDESIVTFVKSYDEVDKKDKYLDGAPVKTVYVFKGLKEGETTITFKYKSLAVEGEISMEEVNTVRVSEKGKISLVK